MRPCLVPVYRGAVHCVSGVCWVKTTGRLLVFVCHCERCTDDSALSERDARQRDVKYAGGYDRDGMEPLELLPGGAPSERHFAVLNTRTQYSAPCRRPEPLVPRRHETSSGF